MLHLALTKATIDANIHGGAHSRKVTVREYPRVSVRAEERWITSESIKIKAWLRKQTREVLVKPAVIGNRTNHHQMFADFILTTNGMTYENPTTCAADERLNHQTFQSVSARYKPRRAPVFSLSLSPTSSAIRTSARRRSSGVSQVVVAGKSGRTKMAITATNTVRVPSM